MTVTKNLKAKYVEDVVPAMKEKFGYKNFLTSNVGPMIGTHTGASLVVLSYMGDERS